MARQRLEDQEGTQGPRPNARFGPVTRTAKLGRPQPVGQSRQRPNVAGGTRPIETGTKPPRTQSRFGSGQRKTRGVQ